MRYCDDIINLLSLTENQGNALMTRIDSSEEHDDAFYAQYLVWLSPLTYEQKTVNIESLTNKEVIDILNNSV